MDNIINPNEKPDLIFKNAKIIDVFNGEVFDSNLAVQNGLIMGFGDYEEAYEVIDLKGKYISPSFIDSHVHIESSMVSPKEFTELLATRGITAIVADPHEIANVRGLDGIDYILKATENIPFDVYVMLPSSVPATPFETSGAILEAKELSEFIGHERVLGLGEMMDFQGVMERREDIVEKINLSERENKVIDGHGPMISGKELDSYISAGIRTEHEASTEEEMKERIRKGMYILIREGSAARNLETLIKYVNKENLSRCLFCTDDRHPEDLIMNGSIDNNIRQAVKLGFDPIDAIRMASINAAVAYGLKKKGGIAPGYCADFIVFDDLNDLRAEKVYKDGKLIAEDGMIKEKFPEYNDDRVGSAVNIRDIMKDDLKLSLKSENVNIIGIKKNELITDLIEGKVEIEDGEYKFGNEDIVKLSVIERHTGDTGIFTALLKGYGIKNGAIGTTIAHDSHNIIVAGDNDEDILACIKEIKDMQGGIVISSGGKVLESLKLEIAGLMTNQKIEEVNRKLKSMIETARGLGIPEGVDPFMTLSFLALPVIPDVKITDKGLFDVRTFEFISIER